MKDLGFFALFFGLLLLLTLSTGGRGLFSNNATTTLETATGTSMVSGNQLSTAGPSAATEVAAGGPAAATPKKLSNEEVQKRLSKLHTTLDSLSEELRAAKLREPASPYTGLIKLGMGYARDTDPDREYVTIDALSGNLNGINISNWYLESYVTEEKAALPQGDRIIEKKLSPTNSDISLMPGEGAYVITGSSPLNTSFHENLCTGYLQSVENYYPSLSRKCPDPVVEMKRFGNIALDNDACYTFVGHIGICEVTKQKTLSDADISGLCRDFITTSLTYDKCVAHHRYDPLFDNAGTWRIYLNKKEELWRQEREIIRLMDENNKVIDVVEY